MAQSQAKHQMASADILPWLNFHQIVIEFLHEDPPNLITIQKYQTLFQKHQDVLTQGFFINPLKAEDRLVLCVFNPAQKIHAHEINI